MSNYLHNSRQRPIRSFGSFYPILCLIVFLVNLTSLLSASTPQVAETYVMPTNGQAVSYTIADCDADNKFMNDGSHLYADKTARQDTITLCPNQEGQIAKVTFFDFDVASGDYLDAYDGDLQAVRDGDADLLGRASGWGASKAYGAWIAASCTPADNPSGCLTFVFSTNGDNNKGTGWQGWVSCENRAITITPPAIRNSLLRCDEVAEDITIGAAMVTADCGTVTNDSTIVTITNASGKVCVDTILSKAQNMVINETFGIGTYIVTYQLLADPSISQTAYFSVNSPALVCNDEIQISLGSSCSAAIRPDDILENTCDTIANMLYYDIVIKHRSGKNAGKVLVSGTSRSGNYPEVTKEMVASCEESLFLVEITRVYYPDPDNLTFCNNGTYKNTCTTLVDFRDKNAPFFGRRPARDTIFACGLTIDEEDMPLTKPKIIDNCTDGTINLKGIQKVTNTYSCNAPVTYLARWEAADACGNVAFMTDTIVVLRPGIDKIILPETTILSCGEDDSNTATDLSRTGVPRIITGTQKNGFFTPTDTLDLNTETYVCDYIARKSDQRFPSDCGDKYYRTWTIADWCDDGVGIVELGTQLIHFKDTLAPVLSCSQYNSIENAQQLSLPAFECAYSPVLPTPTASDLCNAIPSVQMFSVEQWEDNGWWKLGDNLNQTGDLPAGTYRAGYRAFDDCHEQTKEDSCYHYFIINDQTKPSAVCEDVLNISLSNNIARVYARDIDAGSWDACGLERMLVRRAVCDNPEQWQGIENEYVKTRLNNKLNPTGWADYVSFECCDLYQKVKVELLVIDVNGNFNYCWMEVIPEDKINPVCGDLPNQWEQCNNIHNGELGLSTDTDGDNQFDDNEWQTMSEELAKIYNEKYGQPYEACADNLNCQAAQLEQQYQLINEECGVMNIKRRFRIKDESQNNSNWGEQYISVEYSPDWSISLPVDFQGACGSGVPEPELIINNGTCDVIGYEVYDQQFDIVNDACFKVIRTYHIINWCNYKPGDQPIQLPRLSNNKGEVTKSHTIVSDNYANASYFTYIQILKVTDDEAPIVEVAPVTECLAPQTGCADVKTFAASATDCNDASNQQLQFSWEIYQNGTPVYSGTGSQFDYTVQPGTPYSVKWRVSDRCGNIAEETRAYNFRDCKKPSPYALHGLVLEMGQQEEVDIWASDFNHNSSDNCTSVPNLEYRLWHQSLGIPTPTTTEEAAALPSSLTLGCNYVGSQTVYFYVIDEAGNFDFTITYMNVQDNMGACKENPTDTLPPMGQVAGSIYTEYGEAVQDAEVQITNVADKMMMTEGSGNYQFELEGQQDYTIVPAKNTAPLNGVSTFDLVQITKYILGRASFTPYQLIAADVNASGNISTFDIIQLRKLILNISTTMPDGNTSWRFVDAGYEFTTEQPLKEAFPEYINVNNLQEVADGLDFIAIKVGDVNGNAATGFFNEAEARNKTSNLFLQTTDQYLQVGDMAAVTLTAADFEQIEGFQFTLQFDGLELIDFSEGIANSSHTGLSLKERGYLTASWNQTAEKRNEDNPVLFKLTFRATEAGQLSSKLRINNDLITAEAYRTDGALLGVTLQTVAANEVTRFLVGQNAPNPFRGNSFIPIQLPETGEVQLKVLDVQGRVILENTQMLAAGSHQLLMESDNWQAGAYYYQITTPFGTVTKKMMVK